MPVKPSYIKELGREIRIKYPKACSKDFESNKELVEKVTNVKSKTIKNRVSGYISGKES